MLLRFKGWVPTVSGNLSFSAFGLANHPTPAITANVDNGDVRYIISYQARDVSDAVIPLKKLLGPHLLQIEGRLWFLCIAKTCEHDGKKKEAFKGRLYIYHPKKTWRNTVEPIVRPLQDKMKGYQAELSNYDFPSYFESDFQQILVDAARYCSFYVDFSLLRSGVVELIWDGSVTLPENSPQLPDSEIRRQKLIHQVSAQLFFFLRDIGHRHQHHDPSTDTIVDLHLVDNSNDIDWRLATLFSMYRRIIAYKRTPHSEKFPDTLGILAYTKTFRSICQRNLPSMEFAKFPVYEDVNMEQSIQSIQNKIMQERSDASKFRDNLRNTILGIIGVTLSVTQLIRVTEYRIKEPPHDAILYVADIFAHDPIWTIAAVIFAVYLYFTYLKIASPEERSFFRNMMRLLQHFKRRWMISAFFGMGVLVLFLTWLIDKLILYVVLQLPTLLGIHL